VLQIPMTEKQMQKIDKLADNDVSTTAAYTRRHLVKTLKLKDDHK